MNSFIHWFSGDMWTFLDAMVTVGTLIVASWSLIKLYHDRKIASERISIVMRIIENQKSYRLKIAIPRKDINRAEIQGILSNFSKDSTKRYNIDSMSTVEYLERIYDVQENRSNSLVIDVLKKEFEGYTEGKTEYTGFDREKMELNQ